jgi:tRNA isopentenyl-2-thiomethyl-A-37 hydroxylase MiaE
MNTQFLPTIPEVLADPCSSYWLKDTLRSALKRDIVDAANDAQVLAEVLADRCENLTRQMHAMAAEELRHWNDAEEAK